jgi:anti-anti-sigma regulatory factor
MSIEIRQKDHATVLDLTEDLISPQQAEDLKDMLQKLLQGSPRNAIINFSRVHVVNQKSWGHLAHCVRDFRHEGRDIKLVGLNPKLKEHFDRVLHLSEVLETYATEDEALASFTDNVSKVERNILWKLKQ